MSPSISSRSANRILVATLSFRDLPVCMRPPRRTDLGEDVPLYGFRNVFRFAQLRFPDLGKRLDDLRALVRRNPSLFLEHDQVRPVHQQIRLKDLLVRFARGEELQHILRNGPQPRITQHHILPLGLC